MLLGTSRARGLLGLGLAGLLFLLAACAGPPREPLRIATSVWVGFEPLYLARSLDLLPPGSVRLVEMSSSVDTMRAFRDRLVDGAALTLDEVLTLAQDQEDLRLILVTDVSHGGDALLASRDIPDLRALRGKRVGVEHTAAGAWLLTRALQSAGMRASDVVIVPVTEAGHEKAFISGEVDAVVTFEPVSTHLLNRGAHVLFDSSRIQGEIVDVLVVREELLQIRPKDLRGLLDGWFSALDLVAEHPRESAVRMAPRLGLEATEVQRALAGLRFPDRRENERLLKGPLQDTARKISRVMLDEHLLVRPVDPAPLFGGFR